MDPDEFQYDAEQDYIETCGTRGTRLERHQCVYFTDGPDDRSCIRPNCSTCSTSLGRMPYCKYAYNHSCTYYNCWLCEERTDDNLVLKIYKSMKEIGDPNGFGDSIYDG